MEVKWSASYPGLFTSGERDSVPIEQEATVSLKRQSAQTLDHAACSLGTTLTTLFWFAIIKQRA